MAEEVEITNYGKDGVASEETLAALLKTMERLSKSKGFDPKEVNKKTKQLSKSMQDGIEVVDENRKALDKHTDAVKSNTSKFGTALSLAGAGIGMVTNRVTALSEQLLFTGSTLTDFASEIPFIGTLLAPLTGVIDNTVDTYREFSTIGGTAGKSLYDFSKMATEAGMPMNDFRQLVLENSQSMKLFGSTTTEGMRNLSALSKEFRKGPGEALFQLGFTSTELNETLVDLAELNSNMFTMGRIRDKITAKSAADLSNTLFDLSAITGKRRDQLKDEMKQAASDYRARVAMSAMSEDEQKRFNANLTIGGATMKEALLDMADGIPQSDLAQRLTAMSSVFREKSRDIENMDPREMNNFVVDVRTQLEAFAAANGTTIQALAEGDAGIRGMLEFTNESKDLNKLSKEEYAAQLKEKAAMQSREDSILKFQEALNTLRTKLMDALIDSKILETVQKTFETIGDFFGPESTIFTNLFTGLDNLTPSVTSVMESFQAFLEAFAADPKQAINDALSGIGKSLGDTIKDIFLGAVSEKNEFGEYGRGKREGGLLDGMLKSLAPLGSTIMTSITEGISSIWGQLTFIEKVGVAAAGLFAVGGVIATPLIAGITSLFAAKAVTGAMLSGAKGLWDGLKAPATPKPITPKPDQLLDKNGKPLKGAARDARIEKLNKQMSMPETKSTKNLAKTLGALLKGGGKFIPGVGLVIAGGAGAYDAVTGFNADPNAGLGESTVNALSSLINGLTFGLLGSNSSEISNRAQTKDVTQEDTNVTTNNALNDLSVEKLEKLSATSPGIERLAGAFERIGAVQGLQENMASFQADLKLTDMMNFNAQLSEMGENFKEINRQLSKDNKFGPGNGVNAGSLFENNGSSQGIDPQIIKDLNSTLSELVGYERNEVAYLRQISKNTGGMPSDVSANPTSTSRGRNNGRSGR